MRELEASLRSSGDFVQCADSVVIVFEQGIFHRCVRMTWSTRIRK